MALMAGGGAVVVAMLFYTLIPDVRIGLRNTHRSLLHPRLYSLHTEGGAIQYRHDPALSAPRREQLDRFERDLAILSRRFRRGDFQMVAIPGSRRSAPVQAVSTHARVFRYEVVRGEDEVTLHIRTLRSPSPAVAALHEYLNYLKDRWFVGLPEEEGVG